MNHMQENQIAVVGLGYVGLPLSLQFARSGATDRRLARYAKKGFDPMVSLYLLVWRMRGGVG